MACMLQLVLLESCPDGLLMGKGHGPVPIIAPLTPSQPQTPGRHDPGPAISQLTHH